MLQRPLVFHSLVEKCLGNLLPMKVKVTVGNRQIRDAFASRQLVHASFVYATPVFINLGVVTPHGVSWNSNAVV